MRRGRTRPKIGIEALQRRRGPRAGPGQRAPEAAIAAAAGPPAGGLREPDRMSSQAEREGAGTAGAVQQEQQERPAHRPGPL